MSSRDLALCVPELQEKWPLIKVDYEAMFPGRIANPICTLRTTDEQQKLYARGRTVKGRVVTWVNGVTRIGAHNPIPGQPPCSRAIDIGVFVAKKYMTSDEYYKPFQELAHKYGLKSGYDFPEHAIDPPHLEIAEGAVIEVI